MATFGKWDNRKKESAPLGNFLYTAHEQFSYETCII